MSETENYCAVFRDKMRHDLIEYMSMCLARTKYRKIMDYGLENITFALIWDDLLQTCTIDFRVNSHDSLIIWESDIDVKKFETLSKPKKEELTSLMEEYILEFLPLLASIFDHKEEISIPMPVEYTILNYIKQNFSQDKKIVSYRDIAVKLVESKRFPNMSVFDFEKIMRENELF